jgi:hypothetical protein
MKIEHIHIGAIVHKVRLAIVLAFGLISTAHATLIPILEYPMGEGDSPNGFGGPAANPSNPAIGSDGFVRRGAPSYVAGQAAIGSTHAVQLETQPGVAPQFYSTDFDFNPTEPSRWGFSCWVKFNALPDPDKAPEVTIMHIGDINAGSIILQTWAKNGTIVFGTHAPGIAINVGNTEVQLGRWTHLAVVFDGTGKLYVNGVEDGNVGGGQNPPAGVTVGASRFTPTSYGATANITIDDVRVFEVENSTFVVEDLAVPPVVGPFVLSSSGDPFGFTLEIQDNGGLILDLNTISLKLNGETVLPTSVTQPGNTVVELRRPVENPLPAGVYGIEISYKDTAGQTYSDARSFRVRGYTLLPLEFLNTAVDTAKPGFLIRSHQVASGQPNLLKWTEEQLAGLHGPNLAFPSGTSDGYYERESYIDFRSEPGRSGNFPNDAPFSEIGIPGDGVETTDNSAAEVLTYLEFPAAGFYTLGVNSDDGFRVTTAANPLDKLAVTLGELDGDRTAADTLFRIYVPQAGSYPFRLIWENGSGEAALEWFSVLPDETKVLINDSLGGSPILAYRAAASPAYVSSVSPQPGETDARGDVALTVKITDAATTVETASVKLGLNGPAGTPTSVSKAGGIITAVLAPSGRLAAGSTNTATLVYTDSGGRNVTRQWSFVVAEETGAVVLITPSGITQKAGDTLGGFPVVNLINNSGFAIPPDANNYGSTAHTAAGNTWVTATSAGPNYFGGGRPQPQFDLTLSGRFQLTHLVVWGYGGNNNEASDFTVEFSNDGGVTFAESENVQTSALLGGNSEALAFATPHMANAIRITMTANAGGRGFTGAGTGDRAGLGEIKLLGRALSLVTPSGITQKAGDTLGGFPVVNLINNSGFAVPPDANNYPSTSHTAAGNTWVTATSAGPNYFTAGRPAPQFDLTFNGVFELSHLVVWGYGGNNNEASDFTVEFSRDGGSTFTDLETVQTSALLGGNSEALAFAAPHSANAVRITMINNAGGRGFTGAGSGDRAGLGEVKFLGTPVVTVLVTPTGIAQKVGDTLGGFPVVNLINNSGFAVPPDVNNYSTTAHTAAGNTWVTASSAGPNYFDAGRPAPQFDLTLGGLYDLTHLVVWGYGGNNNEASDFTVEFSQDGGVSFSGLESVQTTALLGGNSEALIFGTSHIANAIRITMVDNAGGRGFTGAGTGDRAGLGEIKLLGSAARVSPISRPTLTLAPGDGGWVISWPASASGFVLESTDRLPEGVWSAVDGVVGNQVTLANPEGNRFFRLRK